MLYALLFLCSMTTYQLEATETAVASWYGPNFHGRLTACGETYDMTELTCAHKTLPMGTVLAVEYGKRRVIVTVNDRGPYVDGRDIDLSLGAFKHLTGAWKGVIDVRYVVLCRDIRPTMLYNLN